jgi:hypothetical protein
VAVAGTQALDLGQSGDGSGVGGDGMCVVHIGFGCAVIAALEDPAGPAGAKVRAFENA